jgi:hypothetical protein
MARIVAVLTLTALATGLGSLNRAEASPAPSTSPAPTAAPAPQAAPVLKQPVKRCWYYQRTKHHGKVKRWTTCKQTQTKPAPKPKQPQWSPKASCNTINGVVGGTRPGHRAALDYPATDSSVFNTAMAQMNSGQCNIEYVIWRQTYYPAHGRAQPMEDRGSPTQNHEDHVHVEYRGG